MGRVGRTNVSVQEGAGRTRRQIGGAPGKEPLFPTQIGTAPGVCRFVIMLSAMGGLAWDGRWCHMWGN